MAQVKPNEEAFRKKKNSKLTLKRVMATLSVAAIMGGTGHFVYKNYTDVNVPEGFDYTGISVSSNSYFDCEGELTKEEPVDFVMIEVNDWKKAVTNESIENIKNCNSNNIPCGIMLKTESTNPKEAQADAACIIATIGENDINCKVNYNLDEIADKVSNDELIKICNAFMSTFNRNSESFEIAFSGTKETLDKIGDSFHNNDMLLICKDKDPSYDGKYTSCYFERTGEYYTSNKPVKELKDVVETLYIDEIETKESKEVKQEDEMGEEEQFEPIKGIDVSEFQGKIDWEKVKEAGVKYSIIRFTEYNDFYNTGNLIIDSNFYDNISECERLNIPYGIYCYTKADTEEDARREARVFLEAIEDENINPNFPIYYDIELKRHQGDPENSAKLCKAFCEVIEGAGYQTGIYASYYFMRDMIEADETLLDYNKWVANYKNEWEVDFEDYTTDFIGNLDDIGKYDFVQVSEKGSVPGIHSNLTDLNYDVTGISNIKGKTK